MDKDRVKKLCKSVLGISYSGITICDFDMTPTFKYDESLSKWVPDSFALFVQIKSSSGEEIALLPSSPNRRRYSAYSGFAMIGACPAAS